MSGITRDSARVKATAEVFTPTKDVQRYLDLLPPELFSDTNENFLDYACGDGQFLSEALIRKLESLDKKEITDGEFEQALSTIYGVDLMIDNVDLCRERLLCGQKHLQHIVEKNIVCHDALTYDYSFNGTDLNQDDLTWNRLFSSESEVA
jgi:type I restriction-modification system DNA methylase subunit